MLKILVRRFRGSLRRDDDAGQTLVEYGLLLALIAIIVFAALVVLGPIVSGIFDEMGDSLESI